MICKIVKNGILEQVPEMKVYHFHVSGTLDTDTLTPPSGKRICVYGFTDYNISITAATNSTLEATLAFGTGHATDANKILTSARKDNVGTGIGGGMAGIEVFGEVNEILRLTNMTFAAGTAHTRINVFYTFI